MKAEDVLGSLSVFMFAGFVLGLIFGDPTGQSAILSMILLGVMMTLAMSEMSIEFGRNGRGLAKGLMPVLMTFAINTPVFLAASFLFSGDLALGWMLTAAMPAAVAIVPYSQRMRGDMSLALHGEIAVYLISLIVTPAIALVALNASVDLMELLKILLLLILIPLALSRGVQRLRLSDRSRNLSMNLTFLLFFFVVVGANKSIFFEKPETIGALALASFVTMFGTGTLMYIALRKSKEGERRTLTMFSTIKNTGLAITVALSLGMPEMAVPATMLVIFEMIWAIFLSAWKFNDRRRGRVSQGPS